MTLHRRRETAHVVDDQEVVQPDAPGANRDKHVPRQRHRRRGRHHDMQPQAAAGGDEGGRELGKPAAFPARIDGGLPPAETAQADEREHQPHRSFGQHRQAAGDADTHGRANRQMHCAVSPAGPIRCGDPGPADEEPQGQRCAKHEGGVGGCGSPRDARPEAGRHRQPGPEPDLGAEQGLTDVEGEQAGADREQG